MLQTKKLDQLGFTLIEIMIASVILAGVALSVAKLAQDQFKSAKTVETKFDYGAIASDIRTILSDQNSCTATFLGSNAQATAAGVITQIIHQTNAGVNNVRYAVNNSTAANSTGTRYGASKIRLNSIALNHAAPGMGTSIISPPNNTGTTTLILRFWTGNNKSYTSQFVEQRIVLNVTTNGANNNIVTCSSAAADNSLNDLELACTSIDGTFDPGTARCDQRTYVSLPPPMDLANTTAFSSVSTRFLFDWMTDAVNGLDARYVRKIPNVTEVMQGRLEMRGAAGVGGIGVYRGNLTMAAGQIIQMDSDRSLKRKITRLRDQLPNLRKLRPARYIWRSTGEPGVGLIAQEVHRIFPELVLHSPNSDTLTVNYIGLTPMMLQGIKELDSENQKLKSELSALRKQIDNLNKVLCRRDPQLEICK